MNAADYMLCLECINDWANEAIYELRAGNAAECAIAADRVVGWIDALKQLLER